MTDSTNLSHQVLTGLPVSYEQVAANSSSCTSSKFVFSLEQIVKRCSVWYRTLSHLRYDFERFVRTVCPYRLSVPFVRTWVS